MKIIKRYKGVFITAAAIPVLYLINAELGKKALTGGFGSIIQMLHFLPPIFILLGLMDVWVPRETMMRLMGEQSGIKGTLLALMMGSLTAGPLYGAFPVAAVMMRKGVKYSNILVFVGAWSTAKLLMLLFESTNLGLSFALLRLALDIPGILIIAKVISVFVSEDEQKEIYRRAEEEEYR